MRRLSPFRSLRVRLVLVTLVIEVGMLALLVANSVAVNQGHLLQQAELRLRELQPLLNTALAAPLAERDFGTLDEVLAQARDNGVQYLVLFDHAGRVVSAAGRADPEALPPPSARFGVAEDGVYHARLPIVLAGQDYGLLRFGISEAFLAQGRAAILQRGIVIAALAVLVSAALLVFMGYWLTRDLTALSRASERFAAGELDVHVPVTSQDEVGQLIGAFNAMSEQIRARITALRASEAKFHAIADYTYDWESWFDPQGKLIWINPSVRRMTGYSREECLAMEDFPAPLVAEEDRAKFEPAFSHAIKGNAGSDFEFRAICKDGSMFWAAANWQPIYSAEGKYLGIRAGIRDISELKEAEWALRDAVAELQQAEALQRRYLAQVEDEQARLVSLLSAMNIGILFVSVDGEVIYHNPAFLRIWMISDKLQLVGQPATDVLRYSANVLARPDHFSKHLLQVLDTHEVSETYEIQMADGRVVTQLSYPVRDKEGRFIGRLWIYEDVTRERQTAEQLIYLAERDSLTGLYNRHRFQEELGRMIADAERHDSQGALLFFDLDEFKYINDTFGHRAGDSMLIRVAGEVGALVRRNEIFSRLGGDEFAVLIPDAREKEVRVLAERIIRAIAQIPFRFEGQNLRLTTSLGIAFYPRHAGDAEELIAHADAAMYQAKEAGKNGWRVYRPDLDASREMVSRLSWNDRISHAMENGLLELHYQGIYRAGDGALSHLEVLVRMMDAEDPSRVIMPGHFIPVAEKSGKVVDIDRWVLRSAIELLGSSEDIPPLAVNVSARSFDEPTLPMYIAELLSEYEVDPRRLWVELTETAAVSDLHDAERFIEALHQTGCSVSLDDFGTGFSSFAYLKHLKADVLKIDGLFVRDLANDRDNQVFVKAIVDVARGMRKTTIAEFVEDAQTLAMLQSFGVDMVQGYYLDTPRADHPAIVGGDAPRPIGKSQP